MSNPTTPFSWQMPTAVDLVTDLPADFEVFGQAVATSMADLLGGASGYILSKASATDMDFAWIANDQGDITGVTATSPLTGGGSSGAITVGIQDALTTQKGAVQLSDSTSTTSSILAATPTAVKSAFDTATTANTTANAAIPKSTVTTNGDVIYATGSAAVTRLGIGSAGQVLTVAAGIPSWATPATGGGMTLLSTTTLSGATTTVTIAGGYKDLKVIVFGCTNATGSGRFRIAPNASTTIVTQTGTGVANNTSVYNNYIQLGYIQTFDNPTYNDAANVYELEIFGYTSTTARKVHRFTNFYQAGGPNYNVENWGGGIQTTSAITSLVFSNAGGNYSAGTVLVYGVS